MTDYKPLEIMIPTLNKLFEESFRSIQTKQNAGFLVCEDDNKNLAIGGVCKGDCYSVTFECPAGWKRRIAVLAHYQI